MVYNSVTACFSDRFLQQKFISISYYMSFRNSGKGCGERIPPPSSRGWKLDILLEGIFYRMKGT